jgi:hypothetical protein
LALDVELRAAFTRALGIEVGGALGLEGERFARGFALDTADELALGFGLDVDVAASFDTGVSRVGVKGRGSESQGTKGKGQGITHV